MLNVLKLLFSPLGELNRSAFVVTKLVLFGLTMALAYCYTLFAIGYFDSVLEPFTTMVGFGYILLYFYVSVCLAAKRLRNSNINAFYSLIMLIPLVGIFLTLYITSTPARREADTGISGIDVGEGVHLVNLFLG